MIDKDYLYNILTTQLLTMVLAILNMISAHTNGNYVIAIISAILAGGLAGYALNTYKEVKNYGIWMWNI